MTDVDETKKDMQERWRPTEAAIRHASEPGEKHPHGTWQRYNAGCHCTPCRAAHLERWRNDYERRTQTPPEEIPHGVGGYLNWGCRCDVCVAAHSAQCMEYQRRTNEESMAGATKRGQVWTGPELEVAARSELTAIEVAQILGRTVSGVRSVRSRLKKEPELQLLAGLTEN